MEGKRVTYEEDVMQILGEVGAYQKGHFLLSSGLHSDAYIEKFRVLERPFYTERLCRQLADKFRDEGITCVIGPTTGGIIVAYEVARHLPEARAIFAEREGDGRELRRGFHITPGENVLVVEDVVTTGGSCAQVVDVVRRHGGRLVGVGVLVDRSGGSVSFGPRYEPLIRLSLKTYAPGECPLCEAGVPLLHPGSSPIQGS
ncbi:MAG TPA: orotate phosphoribosyltransferase [Firmicutes bacterium]|nr:orotate phosphoribosyltransferase [Bacillota bacterium]